MTDGAWLRLRPQYLVGVRAVLQTRIADRGLLFTGMNTLVTWLLPQKVES
jgi:hypothetical protein